MITLFLANVIGWYLVIISLFLLLRQTQAKAIITDILSQPGLYFFVAILTLILGLLMVSSHNIWVMGWPVVVTIFCWLVLVGGLVRIFFADTAMEMGRSFIKNPVSIRIVSIVCLLLGLFLLFKVYFAI